MPYEQIRKELDSLFELTKENPEVYQRILEVCNISYNAGKDFVTNAIK